MTASIPLHYLSSIPQIFPFCKGVTQISGGFFEKIRKGALRHARGAGRSAVRGISRRNRAQRGAADVGQTEAGTLRPGAGNGAIPGGRGAAERRREGKRRPPSEKGGGRSCFRGGSGRRIAGTRRADYSFRATWYQCATIFLETHDAPSSLPLTETGLPNGQYANA